MRVLLQRQFVVPVSVEQAWRHLGRVTDWPTWARHIRRVEVDPPGELTARSRGRFVLANGVKSTFVMTEYNPHRNWKWAGPFLWLRVHYDHRFEPVGELAARLTWVIEAEGFGVSTIGRLFAMIYARNLDRAIPILVDELGRRWTATDAGPTNSDRPTEQKTWRRPTPQHPLRTRPPAE